MKRLLSLILLGMTLSLSAASIDEVKELVLNGEYSKALSEIEPLRKKSPRDANINYWYAQALLGIGREKDGMEALRTAAERGSLAAYQDLAEIYLEEYDVEQAENYIDGWRDALKKAKKSEPDELAELESNLLLMSNQLNRVEDIPVIARYNIPTEAYVNALNRINGSHASGTSFVNENVPFFINNTSREIFWTQPDENGVNRLFTAGILDDGTREEAVELTQFVGDGDIVAPFMMEDGETLYFASNRNGSLGGYDIYMTRRDGNGGFYEPSNIGMPYNSPANDLLFVIDEQDNVGWWITDRFDMADSVAVMVFVPNATRVNVPAETGNLVSRAKVDNIGATIPDGFKLADARKQIPTPATVQKHAGQSNTFRLSLGNGRIVTSTDDFRSREAAQVMSEVLRMQRTYSDMAQRLESMRRSYAQGDKSLRDDIRSLEADAEQMQADIKTLTNKVIRLETR